MSVLVNSAENRDVNDLLRISLLDAVEPSFHSYLNFDVKRPLSRLSGWGENQVINKVPALFVLKTERSRVYKKQLYPLINRSNTLEREKSTPKEENNRNPLAISRSMQRGKSKQKRKVNVRSILKQYETHENKTIIAEKSTLKRNKTLARLIKNVDKNKSSKLHIINLASPHDQSRYNHLLTGITKKKKQDPYSLNVKEALQAQLFWAKEIKPIQISRRKGEDQQQKPIKFSITSRKLITRSSFKVLL